MTKDTIGVILPWQAMYTHTEILQGVRAIATPQGYRTLAFYGAANSLHQYIDKERITAWLIVNSHRTNSWLDELDPQIPQLIISPEEPHSRRGRVIPDNEQGARIVVEHLISHGHRRIVFLGGLRHADIAGRYRGYQQALEQAGIAADPNLVLDITWQEFWRRDAADDMMTALLLRDIPFTAVFAATDELAIGVMTAFQRVNIHVPNTVAVVGFDDSPAAATTHPPLTTVRQSFVALGETAARHLIEMTQTMSTQVHTHQVVGQMVTRESCGCEPQYIRDNLLATIEEQSTDEKIQIMAIVHCLVGSHDKSTAAMYTNISRLYKGFQRALSSDDIKDWSFTLEQTLPSILRNAEMVSNIPFALQMLSHSIMFPDTSARPDPGLIARAQHLIEVAEHAMLFFSRLASQAQDNTWFEIINAIRSVSSTLVHLNYEELIDLSWLYSCDIHYAALYLVDHDQSCLRLKGLFHESRVRVKELLHEMIEFLPIPGSIPRELETPSMVYALSFQDRGYGWLYIVPKAKSSLVSQTYYGIWVEQLAGLLDRLMLERKLQNTTEALHKLQKPTE